MPREHHEAIWDLPGELIGPLFANAQLLSIAVRDAMGAEGAFVAANNVVSQSVPHFHIHVVPRVRKDGLRGFFWPRRKYESDGAPGRDGGGRPRGGGEAAKRLGLGRAAALAGGGSDRSEGPNPAIGAKPFVYNAKSPTLSARRSLPYPARNRSAALLLR